MTTKAKIEIRKLDLRKLRLTDRIMNKVEVIAGIICVATVLWAMIHRY